MVEEISTTLEAVVGCSVLLVKIGSCEASVEDSLLVLISPKVVKIWSPLNLRGGLFVAQNLELGLGLVSTESIANADKLRLYVLNIDDSKLWPDGSVQKCIGLRPCPAGRRNNSGDSCIVGDLISLDGIRFDELIARGDKIVENIECLYLGGAIVRAQGLFGLCNMGRKRLVIAGSRNSLQVD